MGFIYFRGTLIHAADPAGKLGFHYLCFSLLGGCRSARALQEPQPLGTKSQTQGFKLLQRSSHIHIDFLEKEHGAWEFLSEVLLLSVKLHQSFVVCLMETSYSLS